MGSIRMGPPPDLVEFLAREASLKRFVETGTFRGGTARWAAARFAQVVTVEASPEIWRTTKAALADCPNLAALHGDSGRVLAEQVPVWREPALFWLDAHWSGGETHGVANECPLLAELAVLNACPVEHVLLVDDARCFTAPPARPHRAEEWPDLPTTVGLLAADGRRFVALWDDVLIAVPTALRAVTVAWLQDRATEAHERSGQAGLGHRVRRKLVRLLGD